jgi:6-pyruvoyl-tetrahydropterin synthase
VHTTATFTRRFSAAHRVAGDPGVCQRIHGHNYEAVIRIDLYGELDQANFVFPADRVKALVDRKYDHRLILDDNDPIIDPGYIGMAIRDIGEQFGDWVVTVPGSPSTEFLAHTIADAICADVVEYHGGTRSSLLQGVKVRVQLRETPTIEAIARAAWTQ